MSSQLTYELKNKSQKLMEFKGNSKLEIKSCYYYCYYYGYYYF